MSDTASPQNNPVIDRMMKEAGKDHLTGNARKNYRKALKRKLDGSRSTSARKLAKHWLDNLVKQQANRCNICNRMFSRNLPASLDHIRPLARGGEHAWHNVQALCRPCNFEKADT